MSPHKRETTVTGRYDRALLKARDHRLPPGFVKPRPTKEWPPENIALLERFVAWLSGGGASEQVTRTIYIPMAGHILGLNLKPHQEIDLDADLEKAMGYVATKQVGEDWKKVCRMALERFRRFMMHDRGQVQVKYKPYDVKKHTQGMPAWLVEKLERYQLVKQRNWNPARLYQNIQRFWAGHLRLWRYLCEQCSVRAFSDLKRSHLMDYIDYRLDMGNAVTTINNDLRTLHGFLGFLQEHDYAVSHALLHSPCLKEPDALPRFLTDDQVRALQLDFEVRVQEAVHSMQVRDAQLDRAVFYLLWQCGLRKIEVEELRLEDLDLKGKRLTIRGSKSLKDRTVYMTDRTVQVLRAYLVMRGMGLTDHVFLYRNQALYKGFVHRRLKAAGERVGVGVSAHKLRHTCATQLLNAGCRVTSIQKLLGHKRLNTTMIYARVHDSNVAEDYYTAMRGVEKRLELVEEDQAEPLQEEERTQILDIAHQLAQPEVSYEVRQKLVSQICMVLTGNALAYKVAPIQCSEMARSQHPPPE